MACHEVTGGQHPWLRWITGLALAKNSSVAVVALQKCGKYKNEILDESYLEQRWGAVKHVILKRILVRYF